MFSDFKNLSFKHFVHSVAVHYQITCDKIIRICYPIRLRVDSNFEDTLEKSQTAIDQVGKGVIDFGNEKFK